VSSLLHPSRQDYLQHSYTTSLMKIITVLVKK